MLTVTLSAAVDSYTKPKGQIPDYTEPVILHARNPTVEEFCNRLHKTLIAQFR